MRRKNRIILVIFFVVFIISFISVIKAETSRQIAQKSFSSVVLLVMQDENGQPISLGSGFFISDGIIATNLHVIENATRGYAKLVGQEKKYDISGIVGVNDEWDLVLLDAKGIKAPSLTLGDSNQMQVGDEIFVVGNPQGLEGTFSQGIISGIRKVNSDSLFQLTAPISPGSSGGPVLNTEGEVIGIAFGAFKDGQNLNFAIPASYLALLSKNLKPVLPLAKVSKTKKEKSVTNYLGESNIEGVTVSHFLWWSDAVPIGAFTFSIRNNLQQPISKIYCLVVFYDKDDLPIDSITVYIEGPVMANLAKRSPESHVDSSVQKLTKRVDVRVLDFKIMEE